MFSPGPFPLVLNMSTPPSAGGPRTSGGTGDLDDDQRGITPPGMSRANIAAATTVAAPCRNSTGSTSETCSSTVPGCQAARQAILKHTARRSRWSYRGAAARWASGRTWSIGTGSPVFLPASSDLDMLSNTSYLRDQRFIYREAGKFAIRVGCTRKYLASSWA